MHRALTALGVLGALLWASPSWGVGWIKNCQTGGSTITSISAGGVACAEPTAATTDTEILDVRSCENIDVGQTADKDGDATGATALTATLEWCPFAQSTLGGATATTIYTDAERNAACVDYSGGVITGDGTIQGAGVPSGFVRTQTGGTFAGDPVVWIKCNGAIR